MKKLARILATCSMISLLAAPLHAQEGDCYQDSCCCKISPEWALGGLAVVAIVAVVLQNGDPGHNH